MKYTLWFDVGQGYKTIAHWLQVQHECCGLM